MNKYATMDDLLRHIAREAPGNIAHLFEKNMMSADIYTSVDEQTFAVAYIPGGLWSKLVPIISEIVGNNGRESKGDIRQDHRGN